MSVGSYQVVAHDPFWELRFSEEKRKLAGRLGISNARIEHVGSTSVRGLGAKPIIDLMVGLNHRPSMTASPLVIKILEKFGYVCSGEETVPGTLYCRKAKPLRFNLHLTKHGDTFWKDHLLFRDYLRGHRETAQEYESLKRDILKKLGQDPDRNAYNKGKENFILNVIQKAVKSPE
jgi:GrpB-like predicted nucleotidyltransferase (UPF0157 family)